MATSRVPVRVSKPRCRYPLRELLRASQRQELGGEETLAIHMIPSCRQEPRQTAYPPHASQLHRTPPVLLDVPFGVAEAADVPGGNPCPVREVLVVRP